MTAWDYANTDVGFADWIVSLSPSELDEFISELQEFLDDDDVSVVIPGLSVDEHKLHVAIYLGTARRWRDSRIHPLRTLHELAPPGFTTGGIG